MKLPRRLFSGQCYEWKVSRDLALVLLKFVTKLRCKELFFSADANFSSGDKQNQRT